MTNSTFTTCDGCSNLDSGTHHRCRAEVTSCVDGAKCPDYIGSGNCACRECYDPTWFGNICHCWAITGVHARRECNDLLAYGGDDEND